MAGELLPESWLAEGHAMRRSAISAFRDAGCKILTLQDHRLPPEDDTEFLEIRHQADLRPALLDLIDKTDFGILIAPETGGCLAEIVRVAEDQKPGWHLGCRWEAIELCGDKLQLAKFFHNHQAPHPRTWLIENAENGWKQSERPLVIKPRDGAGSLDTYKIKSSRDFNLRTISNQSGMIVQEFFEGISMSLSVLCDGLGEVQPIAVFDHNRRVVPFSENLLEFQYNNPTLQPPELIDNLENCRNALQSVRGLRGWVGVDFIWSQEKGVDMVIEINPRMTMSFAWLNKLVGCGGEIARDWLYLLERSRYKSS